MVYAYARLTLRKNKFFARPLDTENEWIVNDNENILSGLSFGDTALIKYDPNDQFCTVITPEQVQEAMSRPHGTTCFE